MSTQVNLWLDLPIQRVSTQKGERTLVVDLWLPQQSELPMPTIVYIHGGGWYMGTQYRPPFQPRFIDRGIAVAAITYRLSREAPFPAMLFDCKGAIRWLRAHAGEFNLDPERFGVWGISAGGHLAALIGTTGHLPEWEGNGLHQDQSSQVQAVCAWCGPTDLQRVGYDPIPGEGMRDMVSDLLGGPLDEKEALARAASPITHVHPSNPPHLLAHGTADPVVPVYHSISLAQRMQEAGVDVTLQLREGVDHSLDSLETALMVDRFFHTHLYPEKPPLQANDLRRYYP